MSEALAEPLQPGTIVKRAPSHNQIFQAKEEKRLDELFQSKCHPVSS